MEYIFDPKIFSALFPFHLFPSVPPYQGCSGAVHYCFPLPGMQRCSSLLLPPNRNAVVQLTTAAPYQECSGAVRYYIRPLYQKSLRSLYFQFVSVSHFSCGPPPHSFPTPCSALNAPSGFSGSYFRPIFNKQEPHTHTPTQPKTKG